MPAAAPLPWAHRGILLLLAIASIAPYPYATFTPDTARDLHAARAADGRVGDVAVTRDFVAGIDDHDALIDFIGQHTSNLTEQCRFSQAGAAHQ